MKIKKLLLLAVVTILAVSCQKDPDWEESDNEYQVLAARDDSADFGNYSNYYIADSILLIGNQEKPTYMNQPTAQKIIDEFVSNMNERGYTQTENKEEADLGLQLSYVKSTHYLTGYVSTDPYWWWGYPSYWYPLYWGVWGGWSYSFPVYYSYSENSLLAEMIDLNSPQGEDSKLPVIWNVYINGGLSGHAMYDSGRMLQGIDRAFEISPYLQKNNSSH